MRFVIIDPDQERLSAAAEELKTVYPDADIVKLSCAGDPPIFQESEEVDLVLIHPEVDWKLYAELTRNIKTRRPDTVVLCWDGSMESILVSPDLSIFSSRKRTAERNADETELSKPSGESLAEVVGAILNRRCLHQALSDAETRYQTLFNNIPLGLYLTASEGEILEANTALAMMFGYESIEELKKRSAEELFVDPLTRREQVEELERRGESIGREIRLKRRDGRSIWVRDYARVLEGGDGKLFFQGAMEDVTEKKLSNRRLLRLHEEKERERMMLAGLVDNFPEGVCVLDRERRIVMANPLARSYLELLGKKSSLGKLVGLGDRLLDDILKPDGASRICDVKLNHPVTRIFEVTVNNMHGGVYGGDWLVIIREVTREREENIQARRMERLMAVGQMAAGIAHDFGNIITVISTYSRAILEGGGLPEHACKQLELVVEEGRKAGELVKQIQEFSLRTSGEKEITDLSLFVGQSEMFLRRTIPENVKMELEIECSDCHVMADLGALQQMLANVALNAKDSMPCGGVFRMRLRMINLERGSAAPVAGMRGGRWAVLEFTDTGTGATDTLLPRIFDSYFGEKDSERGRGAAFAQVLGIVRQHDGFMQLGSEEPLGMILRVFLPVVEVDEKLLRSHESADKLVRGNGELVLIVDDEESVLKSTKTALELLGYRTICATGGADALDRFRERRSEIGLVMSDVIMPDMGGVELMKKVRDEDPSARVMLVSGYGGRVNTDSLQNEIAGWLDKPWTLPELASGVRKCLD